MRARARGSGVAFVFSLLIGVSLAACGSSTAGSSGGGHANVSEAKAEAITAADVKVLGAANATSYVVGHPQNVRLSERLLKPLIVANTLQVKESDAVVGNLLTTLIGQLDNTTPGLTTEAGGDEHIDTVAVHRLFVYGLKQPAEVFKPSAEQGVSELSALLAGAGAGERVSPAGAQPPETARALVLRDERSVAPYWPDLARRLQALAASLH